VEKRKRRWRRVVLAGTAALLALLALAPALANTGAVRRIVESAIAGALGRPARVESLSAGWFSGVTAKGLRVFSPDGFDAETLLEVESVRVEKGLAGLLLAGGEIRVVVDGVQLDLEEQPGGRTNFDEVRARLLAPRVRPEKPTPPPPLRVKLRGAEVRFVHLLPRRDMGPEDPLAEDPAVLPPGEGVARIALTRLTAEVVTGADGVRADLSTRVEVDGKGGDLEAAFEVSGDAPKGKVVARGFDLAALAPFFDTAVAGRADVDVEGAWGPSLAARVAAEVSGLEAHGVSEAWVRLRAEARREDDALRLEALSVECASGRLRAEGSGAVPIGAGAGATEFALEGFAALELVGRFLGYDAPAGSVAFRASGSSRDEVLTVTSALATTGVVLERKPVSDLAVDLAATLDLAEKRASVSALRARSAGADLSLSGEVGFGSARTVEVRGAGRADLGQLFAVAKPFLPPLGWSDVAGEVSFTVDRAGLDAGGGAAAKAEFEFAKLRATTPRGETVARDALRFGIDARLGADGVVVVEDGRVDGLAFRGRVARDATGRIEAQGSVSGSVELTPLFLTLGGVGGLEELAGTLAVELSASSAGDVRGTLRVRGLAATGPALRGGTIAQDALAVGVALSRDGGVWIGGGKLEGDAFELNFGDLRVAGAERFSGTLAYQARDLARLLRAAPQGALPEDLVGAGDLHGEVRFSHEAGKLALQGSANAAALTLRRGERGIERERLSARFELERAGGAIVVRASELKVAGIEAHPARLSIDAAGGVAFDGRLLVRLEQAAKLAPEIARLAPEGTLAYSGTARYEKELVAAKGRLAGGGLRAAFDGRVFESRRATIDLDGAYRAAQGEVEVGAFDFALDHGTGRLRGVVRDVGGRREIDAAVAFDLDPAEFAKLEPKLDGEGPFQFKVEVKGPLGRVDGGRVEIAGGRLAAKRLRVGDASVQEADATFEGTLDLARDRSGEVNLTLLAGAAAATLRGNRLVGVTVNQRAQGSLRHDAPVAVSGNVAVRTLYAGSVPVENLRLTLQGVLPSPKPDGDPPWRATGTLRFDTAAAESMEWRDGVARVDLAGTKATLTEFSATLNGGTLKGTAELEFGGDTASWRSDLKAESVRLDQRLSDPLSFLVPILRLDRRLLGEQRLEGTLAADLKLAGTGTDRGSLLRALEGAGQIRLADVSVRGSILLNLLSLRIDQALQGKDYRFRDLVVDYRIADGKVTLAPFTVNGDPFKLAVDGGTGLDGSLDLIVSLGSLKRVRTPLGDIETPLRVGVGIRGTFGDPSLRPVVFNKKFFEDLFK